MKLVDQIVKSALEWQPNFNQENFLQKLTLFYEKYNPDKVDSMIKYAKLSDLKGDIVASNDNYIVDGHHRYQAILTTNKDEIMNIIRVDADIDELLDIAHSFPKSFKQGINESKTMGFKEFIEWS